VRRLRRHLPDGLHHLHPNGEEVDVRALTRAVHRRSPRISTCPELKTERVMIKDEDVCLHCGLCAERCPTGAWDMQKYLMEMNTPDPAAATSAPAQRAA
jgi:formate dehydrogenase beta subunit